MHKITSGILLTLLSGCVHFNNPEDDVSTAIAQHDYASAVRIIEQTPPQHPQYERLQAQYPGIQQADNAYRQQLIREAEDYAAKQQWEAAFTLLSQERHKVTDTNAIDALVESISASEQKSLNNILARRRLAQARAWLASGTQLTMFDHYHAHAASIERNRLQQEHTLLVNDLTELGLYFSKQRQWTLTRDLLDFAYQLDPSQPPPAALGEAQQILNNASRRAAEKRNRALVAEAEQLMNRYQRSGRLDILLTARQFFAQHPNNPALKTHQDKLDAWAQHRFTTEMESGEALYAKGRYHEAYKTWKEIAPLYPNDEELNKKLERSRRVLSTLQELQRS